MITAIIALLQFTTILPLGKTVSFDAFARKSYLYPIAGYIIGSLAAVPLLLLPLPSMIRAVLGIGLILLLSGCNHLDGLLDFGDGLMAHGNVEKRIIALTDRTIGTGGIALGLIITLLSIAAVASIAQASSVAAALITAEVCSKWGMVWMTVFGKPFKEGLHSSIHKQTERWFIIPATLLLIPVCFLKFQIETYIVVFLFCILFTISMNRISNSLFGGVNGDVTGATNEIIRAVILALVAITDPVSITPVSITPVLRDILSIIWT